jgi:hypothetical protein
MNSSVDTADAPTLVLPRRPGEEIRKQPLHFLPPVAGGGLRWDVFAQPTYIFTLMPAKNCRPIVSYSCGLTGMYQ